MMTRHWPDLRNRFAIYDGHHETQAKNGVVAKNVFIVRLAEQMKLIEPWESPPKDL